jgi:hypothetical protein
MGRHSYLTFCHRIYHTLRYRIDLQRKTYSDYLSFLFVKTNSENGKFTQLDKIVITKGNYAQTVNTQVQSRSFKFSDYTGTLVFIGNHTLDLLSDIDKKRLLRRLKIFAAFLKVGVEDRTTHSPYWIDIDKY